MNRNVRVLLIAIGSTVVGLISEHFLVGTGIGMAAGVATVVSSGF
jgi:hypothetical protein